MVKLNVIAVGKVKEAYFRDAVDEYKKRLSKFAEVNLIEVKEENFFDAERNLKVEAESIIPKMKGESFALCVEGRQSDSEKFSKMIKSAVDAGRELTFVIGSSCGLDDSVKAAAKNRISLSEMTFPHTMARVILFEQLYRAFMIMSGGTYHK
ncbi:MAG: 23S rRNA (pseudouridine(1915)-N(3))-methyltransferase RlmH [Clostridia bacterium]|nr:23S rRNA (pseudouridine(1915)-N(3))-methyltransferase RlmH [Clostridia bacterium]